jgi:hypothetical protein
MVPTLGRKIVKEDEEAMETAGGAAETAILTGPHRLLVNVLLRTE